VQRRASRTPPPRPAERPVVPEAKKDKPESSSVGNVVVVKEDSINAKLQKMAHSSNLVEITGSKSGVDKDETIPEENREEEKPKKPKKSKEGKEKKRKHKDKKHKKHKKDRKEKSKKLDGSEEKDVSIEEKLRAKALESLRKKSE